MSDEATLKAKLNRADARIAELEAELKTAQADVQRLMRLLQTIAERAQEKPK